MDWQPSHKCRRHTSLFTMISATWTVLFAKKVVVTVMEASNKAQAHTILVNTSSKSWDEALQEVSQERLVLLVEVLKPSMPVGQRWEETDRPKALQDSAVIRVTYATDVPI